MGLLSDTKVKVLLTAFVLSLFVLVGVSALGLLAALSALTSPAYAGVPLLWAMLSAAAPYIVADLLVGLFSGLTFVALAVAAVRQASMPRNDRLARVARKVERHYPGARKAGLSERVEPTTEDRIDRLKERYVEGEISEAEYERRLQELMADEDVNDERVRREQRQFDRQFETDR
ncbi:MULTISPECIES: SHOCT domain-containing protein [Halorussus]|uniref:SHOCT domain-containing protein n=1 Tax=Halorussus TaxID=1070314 RepID=UPI0020A20FF6|nr:SHOCT domain-containing protein [Halorussus vallis]USZ75335.1 SHOCT domain-containing protein [Halorussus vallis]